MAKFIKKKKGSEIDSSKPDSKKNGQTILNDLNPKKTKKTKSVYKKKIVDLNPELLSKLWEDYKPSKHLLVSQSEGWRTQLIKEKPEIVPVPYRIRKQLKELAANMYERELQMFKERESQKPMTGQDRALSNGLIRNLFLSCKLKCYKSPVYSLDTFQKLISFVSPKRKHHTDLAFSHINRLLEEVFLADDYVAKEFECHSFSSLLPYLDSSKEIAEKQLVLWYFEDQFRLSYKTLIENLNEMIHEAIYKIKFPAIKSLISLLQAYPNQEPEMILAKLVNKLGDTMGKVAGSTINLLRDLIIGCPQHKHIVVSLVDELLHRPQIAEKSKYYGLCLLKDVVFTKEDGELAAKLVKIYTQFFTSCTKKGQVDTKFMSCLLIGVTRAYPYIDRGHSTQFEDEISTLYKLTHLVNFKIAIQTMTLIFSVINNSVSERFYQLLYNKIQDATDANPVKNNALRLIFEALSKDMCLPRVKAFIKRLLQIAAYQPTEIACGIIAVISNVIKVHPELKISTQVLWEVMPHSAANNFLPPSQVKMISNGVESNKVDDKKSIKGISRAESYDAWQRNPLHSGANLTHIWELSLFANHFQPSLAVFAKKVMKGEVIDCPHDPLVEFSVKTFLERIVNKKAKKPKEHKNVFAAKEKRSNLRKYAFETDQYKELDEEKIPHQDRFIHKYFKLFHKSKAAAFDKDDMEVDDFQFENLMRDRNFSEYLPDQLPEYEDNEHLNFASSALRAEPGTSKEQNEDEEDMEDFNVDEDEIMEFSDVESLNMDDFGPDLDNLQAKHSAEMVDSDDGGSDFEGDFNQGEGDDFSDDGDSEDSMAFKKPTQRSKRKLDEDSDEDNEDDIFGGNNFMQPLEEDLDNYDDTYGTSEAILNKDRSNKSQMKWEAKKLEGQGKTSKKFGKKAQKGGFNKNKKASKRPRMR